MTESELRQKTVDIFAGFMNERRYGAGHQRILDAYNSIRPLPRGVTMDMNLDYCAAGVSAIGVMAGLADIFPLECSCNLQIEQLKAKGVWVENDNYTPKPGDLVYYDWDDTGSGDNTGIAEHVGMIEDAGGAEMTVLEANTGAGFGRRWLAVNARFIRGYGALDYASKGDGTMSETETAMQWAIDIGLIQGYGDGDYGWDDALTRRQFVTMMYRLMVLGTDEQ